MGVGGTGVRVGEGVGTVVGWLRMNAKEPDFEREEMEGGELRNWR